MIPASFDYVRPSSVDDAVAALGSAGEDAKVLAGGQSLLPLLRLRMSSPSTLVDLGGVAELRGVREDGGAVVIGSMTTHDEVMKDPSVQTHAPLVVQATSKVGDPAVRHLGTFGGSLAHADPAADLPSVALALDCEMVVAGPNGRRTVPASEFFVDYLTTAVGPDEILVEVRVPMLGPGWGFHYEKFRRVAQAWATIGVAAAVRRENGSVAEARVALTNMAATPVRASATEAALAGADLGDGVVRACASAAEGTSPPNDLNGSAEYRAHLARVLSCRAVSAAAG